MQSMPHESNRLIISCFTAGGTNLGVIRSSHFGADQTPMWKYLPLESENNKEKPAHQRRHRSKDTPCGLITSMFDLSC